MTTKKIYDPWIKWNGGGRPVPSDTSVEVKLRCGVIKHAAPSKSYRWNHDGDGLDIIEYRTITEQLDLDAETSAAHGNALDQASREELSIGTAINRAARDLPEGWEIRIDLKRYAGVVFLIDPDGNETMSENDKPFSDQINAAIDAAKGEPS